MKIVVAADHGGFELKEIIRGSLVESGHEITDVGCYSTDSVDYPDFAEKAVEEVLSGNCERAVLVCGTGIGMSIAANRHHKIRAANCYNEFTAEMSREHNNANVLCLGARTLDDELALKIVKIWFSTIFAGGRHLVRISKFSK